MAGVVDIVRHHLLISGCGGSWAIGWGGDGVGRAPAVLYRVESVECRILQYGWHAVRMIFGR